MMMWYLDLLYFNHNAYFCLGFFFFLIHPSQLKKKLSFPAASSAYFCIALWVNQVH